MGEARRDPYRATVVVIGAGPAGLAAASAAARSGETVILLDAGARFGGQYWRHSAHEDAPGAPAPPWHHSWSTYTALRDQVHAAIGAGRLRHVASTQVYALSRSADGTFEVHTATVEEAGSGPQELAVVRAETVVLATGAYDRQLPVPGWTLPGVMAAGGVQAFIKVQHTVPGSRVLLAGTGPFLVAAASSVLSAGGTVVAVCESSDLTRWAPGGASAALIPSTWAEGAQYAAQLARHRVPYLRRRVVTEIRGRHRVESVLTQQVGPQGVPVPGTERIIENVDTVGLGWGFTTQSELMLQAGVDTRMDIDGSLVGVVDRYQASSVPGLYLAGEVTGVTGAVGAVAEGRIAGAAAAAHAGAQPMHLRRSDTLARARHRLFARAMHRAHPAPTGWEAWATHEMTVCRCEDVTYAEIIAAREDLALADPRSLKGETRAGMGPCQGRMCGFAVACIARSAQDAPVGLHESVRQVSARPLSLPIALGALAGMAEDADDEFPPPTPASPTRGQS
ncbi:MAG: NAD(P)/FAD-dependent oxidoreductase [Brachybacterium sp.]|nr:NAD(P)/FAD-dependent oxidoreductase [Brachybacterium sp.]